MKDHEEEEEMIFTQESENAPAKFILIHRPSKEIFMSMLHPAASLYENVTEDKSVNQCFRNLSEILSTKGIKVMTVRECLKLNRQSLEELAMSSLKYELDDPNDKPQNEKSLYYLSDDYKREVVHKLWIDQLIDVVLSQPKYKLKYTNTNTYVEPACISFKPLGNLLFCRDQQITTKRGVVLGNACSKQREIERNIMRQVFDNLKVKIIGQAPDGCYLEGGDYFVAKKDLSMLGIGLRTKASGAEYLMSNDLLGTERFALVYDDTDLDQQRMHLDTYFNILSEKYVVALDFDETSKIAKKSVHRKVYLYSKGANKDQEAIDSNNKSFPSSSGNYKLIKVFNNFYDYLTYEEYKCIKVTYQQQLDYMINFLNIGNNTVLTVNADLKNVVKESGVEVIYVEFQAVMKMFGALHCATQVSRLTTGL